MAEAALRPECRKSPAADLSSDQLLQAKRYFVAVAREICPGWDVSEQNRATVRAVFEWCMGIRGLADPDKGLWLYGNVGTGKSTMLRIVKEYCRRIGRRDPWGGEYGFRITSCVEVCGNYQSQGFSGIDDFISLRRQAFDEVGAEARVTGYYGTPLDVIGTVLMGRYDRRHDNITHATTNLTPDELRRRYGDRVYDRCREMFNFLHFSGQSYRAASHD